MSFIAEESLQIIKSKAQESNHTYLYSCNFELNNFTNTIFNEFGICFPEELKSSVNKRQAEFLAGRYAAKQALYHSGLYQSLDSTPTISIGKHRCPVWPAKIIGSITHNHITAACAVKIASPDHQIGIDIEKHFSTDTSNELENSILTQTELAILQRSNLTKNIAITLAFSSKESLFKALFPEVKEYFGFEVAKIKSINTKSNQIILSLIEPFRKQHQLKTSYSCHYEIRKDAIFTLVT